MTDSSVNTEGGAYIAGNASIAGDMIGRDKIVNMIILLSDQATSTLHTMLEQLSANQPSSLKVLFEHHIEPSFRKLEIVHKDYETTLLALRHQLRQRSVDTGQLIDWLEEQGMNLRAEREYLKQVQLELNPVIARSARVPYSGDIQEVTEALERFSTAVSQYFRVDEWNVHVGQSVYFSISMLLELIPEVEDSGTDLRRVQSIQNTLDKLIDTTLSARWRNVLQSYLKLRGLCL